MNAPAPQSVLDTPLAAHHRAAGAALGSWFGCSLPSDFGDWLSEYRLLTGSVALLDKNYRCSLSFTGPDRARYLNAILTNNIKDLAPETGNVSLFLAPQGRIVAEIETYALPASLFCVSYAMIRDSLVAALDKFIIMDDVTLADESSLFGTLALEGPQAAALVRKLSAVDISSLPELGFAAVELHLPSSANSIPARLVRHSPGGVAAAELLVPRDVLPAVWDFLRAECAALGGGPAGYTALNSLRLEQKVPWFSYDFGERQIPHEAGLHESHISYTKGCYTGQEIVERVRSRGQVNRQRVSLLFSSGDAPPSGTPLLSDGKESGFVTRSAFSPKFQQAIGMAYLRREFAAPGSTLACLGASATVF